MHGALIWDKRGLMVRDVSLLLLRGLMAFGCLSSACVADTLLVDPVQMVTRVDFVGSNNFVVEKTENGVALRSTPRHSASGLYQAVDIGGLALTQVVWTWRVDQLQRTADIRKLASEDFGANIMFVFGEPSFFNRDVPTLAYVWTSTPLPNGTVLRSQRYRSLAYIQLRGRSEVGIWQYEKRDVGADFVSFFGRNPLPLKYIAIFNDNDQTGEPTSALFGPIIAR